MGNFNNRGGAGSKPFHKPSYGGGRPSFGGNGAGRGGFGGPRRDDGDRPMFKASCSQCGNECQLPFKPNGSKPVFCSNCFVRDDKPRNDGPERSSYSKPSYDRPPVAAAAPNMDQFKTQLEIIHNKLDRILKLVSPVVTITPVDEEPAPAVAKPAKKKKAVK